MVNHCMFHRAVADFKIIQVLKLVYDLPAYVIDAVELDSFFISIDMSYR